MVWSSRDAAMAEVCGGASKFVLRTPTPTVSHQRCVAWPASLHRQPNSKTTNLDEIAIVQRVKKELDAPAVLLKMEDTNAGSAWHVAGGRSWNSDGQRLGHFRDGVFQVQRQPRLCSPQHSASCLEDVCDLGVWATITEERWRSTAFEEEDEDDKTKTRGKLVCPTTCKRAAVQVSPEAGGDEMLKKSVGSSVVLIVDSNSR